MAQQRRLTAEDWAGAALAALAAGGLAAVAVEPLATGLGATKGSFYWHFANRDALIEATLARWERTRTDDVIAAVEAEPEAATRLRALFATAVAGGAGADVELALQASASHPLVAPVLARVTARRLDYVTGLFRRLGFAPDTARQRGLLAYTAYLGHAQLRHAAPEAAAVSPAYVDAVIAALTAH